MESSKEHKFYFSNGDASNDAAESLKRLAITPDHREPWADQRFDSNGNFSPAPLPWDNATPPVPRKKTTAAEIADKAIKQAIEERIKPESKTPIPLIAYNKPKSDFPVEALGPTLSNAVKGIVDIVQCPNALAAMSVLGAASLATQGHANVENPATGQAKPISLFLLSLAESGERKTSADTEALRSANYWEALLAQQYAQEHSVYKNRFDAWDSERNHILKDKSLSSPSRLSALAALGPQPEPPLFPMLTCPDPTMEGLYGLYQKGHPSLGIFSSEGGLFTGGHGMKDDARIRTGAALCALWDGEPVKRVRATKDETYLQNGKRLSVHVMVQPEIGGEFLSQKDLQGQGFFSRVLVSNPPSTIGTRKQHDKDPLTDEHMFFCHQRLYSIFQKPLPLSPGKLNELCPRSIVFDDDAVILWKEYADAIEERQIAGGEYENVRGFAGKMAENASRIAAVMTLVEDIDAPTISKHYLQNAIAIMDYFAEQSLAMFESNRVGPDMLNAQKLLKWLQDEWQEDHINVRTVSRYVIRSKTSNEDSKRAIEILVDHNWLARGIRGTVVDGHASKDVWMVRRET
jgi:hypothetical protein